jgi:hypothetical protein
MSYAYLFKYIIIGDTGAVIARLCALVSCIIVVVDEASYWYIYSH